MTNGDKIRLMSDDDLAEILGVESGCEMCERLTGGCSYIGSPVTYAECIWHLFQWLGEECKADGVESN